jgi:hypothetical protein
MFLHLFYLYSMASELGTVLGPDSEHPLNIFSSATTISRHCLPAKSLHSAQDYNFPITNIYSLPKLVPVIYNFISGGRLSQYISSIGVYNCI